MSKRMLPRLPTDKIRDERKMLLNLDEFRQFGMVSSDQTLTDMVKTTQVLYDALTPPDPDTVYFIMDTNQIYVGSILMATSQGGLALDPDSTQEPVSYDKTSQEIKVGSDIVANAYIPAYANVITTSNPAYSLTSAYVKYAHFEETPVVPRFIEIDLANNRFRYLETGDFQFTVGFTFDHDESNQGRSFNVRLVNDMDSTVLRTIIIGVGRNTPATNFSYVANISIAAANVNDWLSIELGGGSNISGNFASFGISTQRLQRTATQ